MATLTDAQIAGYAVKAGFTGGDVAIAVAVALAESGGRTDAVNHNTNGTTDSGVWQINSIHNVPGNLFDPSVNALAAHSIYAGSGWRAWSTYVSGKYLLFLPRGRAAAGNPSNTPAASSSGSSSSSSNGIDSVTKKVTSGSLWMRVGAFILGTILLIEALLRLSGQHKTLSTMAKVAMA